jgi:16S rRNA (guanine527-N7)-methyltransferase
VSQTGKAEEPALTLADTHHGARLVDLLEEAKSEGLLGPVPVEAHLAHAEELALVCAQEIGDATSTDRKVLDLGSGAGIPGLPLALLFPSCSFVLLDVGERRTTFLLRAVAELNLADRVAVHCGTAEGAARTALRGTCDAVVARSFAPPGVTCECAAPFLLAGGHLIVTDRPAHNRDDWPRDKLEQLGLGGAESRRVGGAGFVVLEQRVLCPDKYPRREGVPRKRPLF